MNQLINLLALSSLYILIMGVFFLIIRAILKRINCSQILVYRLWLVFPFGLIVMLVMSYYEITSHISTQIPLLQLPSITVNNTFNSDVSNYSLSWINVIVFLWMLMVSYDIVKLIYSYLSFKRLLISSSIKNTNGIYSSDKISTPLAFGVFNANVFVPNNYIHDENSQLLIKHEQIHCDRKDPLIRIIYKTLTSIFWFHPIMYIVNNTMIKDQETSCDELVLENTSHAVAYSKLLLKLNQTNINNNQLPGLYCSSISMLKERIMLINKLKLIKNKRVSYGILSIAIMGMAITTTTLAGMGKSKDTDKPVSLTDPKIQITQMKGAENYKYVSDEGIEVEILKRVPPYYPRKAAQNKTEGFVSFDIDIDKKGEIIDLRIVESVPAGVFDKEAIRSVKQYEFAPVSQPLTIQQRIEFKLTK